LRMAREELFGDRGSESEAEVNRDRDHTARRQKMELSDSEEEWV